MNKIIILTLTLACFVHVQAALQDQVMSPEELYDYYMDALDNQVRPPKAPITKRWALGWHKTYDPSILARKRLAEIDAKTGAVPNEEEDDGTSFADLLKSTPALRWLFRPKY